MAAIWQCPKELISSQIHAVRILIRCFRHAIYDQKDHFRSPISNLDGTSIILRQLLVKVAITLRSDEPGRVNMAKQATVFLKSFHMA